MAIIISFISLLLSKQYFCAILIIKKNPRDIVVDFRLIELQLWKFIIKVPSCDESHQPPFSSLSIFFPLNYEKRSNFLNIIRLLY